MTGLLIALVVIQSLRLLVAVSHFGVDSKLLELAKYGVNR